MEVARFPAQLRESTVPAQLTESTVPALRTESTALAERIVSACHLAAAPRRDPLPTPSTFRRALAPLHQARHTAGHRTRPKHLRQFRSSRAAHVRLSRPRPSRLRHLQSQGQIRKIYARILSAPLGSVCSSILAIRLSPMHDSFVLQRCRIFLGCASLKS